MQTCKPIQKVEDCLGKIGRRELDEFIVEPKLDGFRVYAHVQPSIGVEVYTRNHKERGGNLPHIGKVLSWLPRDTILDGEVIAGETGEDGVHVSKFDFVQSVMNSYPDRACDLQDSYDTHLAFHVFDIVRLEGKDLRGLPLLERRQILTRVIREIPHDRVYGHVHLVPGTSALVGHDTHVQNLSLGYEGSVVKDLTKPYAEGKRGSGWFKLKYNPTVDVIILGFDPGVGKFASTFGAVRFGQLTEFGEVLERGACSGMDDSTRKWMWDNRDKLVNQVMEISHNGLIAGGSGTRFRHPQFQRMRSDKDWQDCDWQNG